MVAKGLAAPNRPAQLQYTAPTMDGDANEGGGQPTVRGETGGEYAGTPRNAPCPCGSGKKYKRCHGDPRNANS